MTTTTPGAAGPARPLSDTDGDPTDSPDVTVLTRPAEGAPPIVATPDRLEEAIASLRSGSGPVAVDAERANGFRYSQRAYLIQLRREGSGTWLIDPIPFGDPADLSPVADAITDAEWVIHAASQDLPCLNEVRMLPRQLFDTELAGRLLGYPRVALGTMLEELFSIRLLKEHSAADWSTRPLPADWITYAALDVELLVGLRDRLAEQLDEAGKSEWARQEFDALIAGASVPPEARPDPWRRTSGIHKVRSRRGLAVVRALWQTRDAIAAELDRAPGKVLTDLSIAEAAGDQSLTPRSFRGIGGFRRRLARQYEADWSDAIAAALALPEADLPPMHITSDGPPQARLWASRDPVAAKRLARVREALAKRAAALDLPAENLLTPEYVRRLAWRPPEPVNEEAVDAALAGYGARAWQRELAVPLITPLLTP
ncbi:HRDC domain-containing protein [Microlunatus parietis]|uniref:Ribonuclease D n=1 Tax=Microlunatus parietis TaxID=682979 RepID=A0A7Y9I237_9ACTN|nr:HRDC domain-containing protein [Microlunatus parietis]NYE68842.1 ribonuclease D [Microlunatus parietis]